MRVLLLSDGIPGHANQSRGMLEWLAETQTLKIKEQQVKLHARALSRPLLKGLLNYSKNNSAIFSAYKFSHKLPHKPDLIISTGGNTVFLNAALARFWSCKNIYIGSLRGLKAELFNAYLTINTLMPNNLDINNIGLDFPPNLISPTKADIAAKLYPLILSKKKQRLWTLIIGGDAGPLKYSQADWVELAKRVNELYERHNIHWLITTSRRTGAEAERILRQHINPNAVAEATWWSDAPKKVMLPYLGLGQEVLVTADSGSMIGECFTSGKTTWVLHNKAQEISKAYINWLADIDGEYVKVIDWHQSTILVNAKNKTDNNENNLASIDAMQQRIIRAITEKIK